MVTNQGLDCRKKYHADAYLDVIMDPHMNWHCWEYRYLLNYKSEIKHINNSTFQILIHQ